MFWKIIRVCLERYSENLANVLVGGILTSEERIREVMNLVEQNLDEETMLKKLREIRVRDNLPMRQQFFAIIKTYYLNFIFKFISKGENNL